MEDAVAVRLGFGNTRFDIGNAPNKVNKTSTSVASGDSALLPENDAS